MWRKEQFLTKKTPTSFCATYASMDLQWNRTRTVTDYHPQIRERMLINLCKLRKTVSMLFWALLLQSTVIHHRNNPQRGNRGNPVPDRSKQWLGDFSKIFFRKTKLIGINPEVIRWNLMACGIQEVRLDDLIIPFGFKLYESCSRWNW